MATTPNPPSGNPYATMSDEAIKTHLTHMAAVIKEKSGLGVNLYDVFGLDHPISVDLQKKLEEHDQFMKAQLAINEQVVKNQTPEPTPTETPSELDSTQREIFEMGLNTQLERITGMDSEAPVDAIKNVQADIRQKITIAKTVEPFVKYYTAKIDTLKNNIPTQGTPTSDQFASQASVTPDVRNELKMMYDKTMGGNA